MTQYLLSVHAGDDNPYSSAEEMQRAFADVNALNSDLMNSGSWVFAGGLLPADTAIVVRVRDGVLEATPGPYLTGGERISGFWVIEAADDGAALTWAEKATRACRGAVELRAFQGMPET